MKFYFVNENVLRDDMNNKKKHVEQFFFHYSFYYPILPFITMPRMMANLYNKIYYLFAPTNPHGVANE